MGAGEREDEPDPAGWKGTGQIRPGQTGTPAPRRERGGARSTVCSASQLFQLAQPAVDRFTQDAQLGDLLLG